MAMTIVTAANQRYWRCLWQYLHDIERWQLQNRHTFLAYDLGIEGSCRTRLERDFPWCHFISLDYGNYPPHVHIDAATYAWKPAVIREVVQKYGGVVLWMDSANLLNSDLTEIEQTIRRIGTFTLQGQSTLREHCDREVRRQLAIPELYLRRERVATIIGLDTDDPRISALVESWFGLCMNESLIAPDSPDPPLHKWEQALLSCLLYTAEWRGELELNDDDIDISCPQPCKLLTTRNKVAPGVPTSLDALVRAYYAVEKALDRAGLTLERRALPMFEGLRKYPKEYYEVRVARTDGSCEAVLDSGTLGYFADPFVVAQKGQLWVFVEEYRYMEDRGYLCAIPLDDELRAGRAQRVLAPPGHVSFPYIFRHAGQLHMVPETSAMRTIDLYRCEAMPGDWRFVSRLIEDMDCADSALFEYRGRWYLVTSVQDRDQEGKADGNRWLAVFHAERPDSSHWEPHPVNQRKLYRERGHGYGRNAGPVLLTEEGELLRPMQTSTDYYVQSSELMQVTRLTEAEFEERASVEDHPVRCLMRSCATHHVAYGDGVIAWDSRIRANRIDWLRNWWQPRSRSGGVPMSNLS